MVKTTTENVVVSSYQKYGVPLYGAAWIPVSSTVTDPEPENDQIIAENHIVLAGGGGEGRSGIPNALIVSKIESDSNSLPDDPVSQLGTGSDVPYRIAVHPKEKGLICSFPENCSWFEWDALQNNDPLNLKSSTKVLEELKDIGQQLALTFSQDGSLLALGGEDGKLRVLKWPSMEIIIDEANAHTSVKDLDFSPDGKYLVTVGSGPGRVWDVTSSKAIASLPKENAEIFSYCRFSRTSEENQVLYLAARQERGGSIMKYNTTTWKRISSKNITRDQFCAFNVSDDGKFLAVGTNEGDVIIINSTNLKVQNIIKKAHLIVVTALMFSHDSRALLSVSMDSSVRVTPIKDKPKSGVNLWIMLLIVLLAIGAYYAKKKRLVL